MRVKCINSKNLINPKDGKLLTEGKFYNVIRYQDYPDSEVHSIKRLYFLIDNTGEEKMFESTRFTPSLEEYREMRINKIIQ
jgi:hypothetical protein